MIRKLKLTHDGLDVVEASRCTREVHKAFQVLIKQVLQMAVSQLQDESAREKAEKILALKRRAMIEEICGTHQAESVHSIGHVVLLYRAAERPDPKLSNLIRKVT